MKRTPEASSNGPVWEWQIRENRARARLANRIGLGTLGVTLAVVGLTAFGAIRGNDQDIQQVLLPPPGIGQGDSDGKPEGDFTYKDFNTRFDRIYDDVINSSFFSPSDYPTITRIDGSTIKLEVYGEGNSNGLSSKVRRIWTSTPFLTPENNPPGYEFPSSKVIYDVKTGQNIEKTIISGSISPEGILRPEQRQTTTPPLSELLNVVDLASEELTKEKIRRQAAGK